MLTFILQYVNYLWRVLKSPANMLTVLTVIFKLYCKLTRIITTPTSGLDLWRCTTLIFYCCILEMNVCYRSWLWVTRQPRLKRKRNCLLFTSTRVNVNCLVEKMLLIIYAYYFVYFVFWSYSKTLQSVQDDRRCTYSICVQSMCKVWIMVNENLQLQ